MFEKNPTENKNHDLIPKTPRTPEILLGTPTQSSSQTPENNPENHAEETEEIINTRSEKYNLGAAPFLCDKLVIWWAGWGLLTLVSRGIFPLCRFILLVQRSWSRLG